MSETGISAATEAALSELAAASDRDFTLCPRCRCCEMESVECYQCHGDGLYGHDCGEDCCACLYPEDNEPCDICDGKGYWQACAGHCNEEGRH
jgi:hypothetical protein